MGDLEQRILTAMRRSKSTWFSTRMLADRFGKNPKAVSERLYKMMERGLVELEDSKNGLQGHLWRFRNDAA